jgi:hypothetical protein
MKNFELENIFLGNIYFGLSSEFFLIIAKDKSVIQEIVENQYEGSQLKYVLGYRDIQNLYREINHNPHLIYIMEMIRNEEINEIIEHKEYDLSLEQVVEKYNGKDIVVLLADDIMNILEVIGSEMSNPQNEPIVDPYFLENEA